MNEGHEGKAAAAAAADDAGEWLLLQPKEKRKRSGQNVNGQKLQLKRRGGL